jgi:hypothetical protein
VRADLEAQQAELEPAGPPRDDGVETEHGGARKQHDSNAFA